MRRCAALLSLLLVSGPAFAADAADFSGFWKRDCDRSYCLEISRIADDAFSVAFCGPASCGGPVWMPRTPIAGDVSPLLARSRSVGPGAAARPPAAGQPGFRATRKSPLTDRLRAG